LTGKQPESLSVVKCLDHHDCSAVGEALEKAIIEKIEGCDDFGYTDIHELYSIYEKYPSSVDYKKIESKMEEHAELYAEEIAPQYDLDYTPNVRILLGYRDVEYMRKFGGKVSYGEDIKGEI
jgi:hypothetical protein